MGQRLFAGAECEHRPPLVLVGACLCPSECRWRVFCYYRVVSPCLSLWRGACWKCEDGLLCMC